MPRRLRIVAIVQARMSSKRLPGKVMKPVAGIPMLQYLLERVSRATRIDEMLVATSDGVEDDVIAAHCKSLNTNCFRGSLMDVAGRFAGALNAFPAEIFIRICGDSPLIDPRLMDHGIELFLSSACDIVTNVFPKTFPAGQSVEILRTSVFLPTVERMTASADREHVTPYFYRHPRDFQIRNFTADSDLSGIRLSVDTYEDFHRLCDIVDRMELAHWRYRLEDIIRLYRQTAVNGKNDSCEN